MAPLLPAPRHPQLPAELSGAHTFLFSPLLLPCIQLEGQARKAKEEGSPGKTNTVHLGPAGLEKNKLEPRVGQAGPQLPGIPRPQNHPAPRKPSPDLEPEPSGPRWTRRRVGGGGQRGAGGNTYLLGHQAGDAHGPSHPAFLGPGLQGPCPARLPQRGRHGGLGSPSLPALGPQGPTPAPHLHPRGWRPGSQGSLWPGGQGRRGWASGLGSPWQGVWPAAHLARAAHGSSRNPGAGPTAGSCALPAASPAAGARRSRNLQLLQPAPPPLGSPPPPRPPAGGPLPRGPRPGLLLQPLLQPAPLPRPPAARPVTAD